MNGLFKLKQHGTKVSTEILAGFTTFFTMAYIVMVNPMILSQSGMEWGAVFLATIISAIIGTLVMGLFANVPYAQAPGMGLNAFFVYTVVFALGFTWQQALSMVFICGVINILITVTKIRKHIIRAIPKNLQHAISGGIGIFIAYIGLLNVGLVKFTLNEGYAVAGASAIGSGIPAIPDINNPVLWVFLIGLALVIILNVMKVKGAILISIVITALIGIPFGITNMAGSVSFGDAVSKLPQTFGAIFTQAGLPSLFGTFVEAGTTVVEGVETVVPAAFQWDLSKLPLVLVTIFAFSLTDTFDTIGTFIGTGRRSGIFSEEDEKAMEESKGFSSKMDKALFADAIATSVGAVVGTSNTTTYVESAAGIEAGGRTGLTSVVVALLFAVSAFLAPLVSAIPSAATAPALVMVGIMMLASFKEIDWHNLEEAVPAFFAGVFMALSYSISSGIAFGFLFYCLVKVFTGKGKEVHPILWVSTALFILNFVLQAIF